MNVLAQVETPANAGVADIVEIANLSEHGARLLGARQWQPREQLVISDGTGLGGFSARAEVIYCEALSNGQFALGVKFAERNIISWKASSAEPRAGDPR